MTSRGDGSPGARRWWLLIPPLVALALHLPWIASPFGPGSTNGGNYFGVYAQTFQTSGFFETRGLPISKYGLQPPTEGKPYVHHPPGTMWLCGWGVKEWQVRLAPVLSHVLGSLLVAVLAHGIMRTRTSALLGGLTFAVVPALSFFVDVSYEPGVIAVGLGAWLLLKASSEGAGHPVLTAWALGFLGFVGTWLDWSMPFWILALWPYMFTGRRAWIGLMAASGGAGFAYLSVGAWQKWALAGPLAPDLPGKKEETLNLLQRVIGDRPSLSEWGERVLERMQEGFGVPLLVVGGAGIVLLMRRWPRPGLVGLSAGLLLIVIPARHAMGHVHFVTFLGVPLALGMAAFGSLEGVTRWVAGAVCAVVLTLTAATTAEIKTGAASPIFKQLGVVLDEASADRDDRGQYTRAYYVRYSIPIAYAFYIRSPLTEPGPFRADRLKNLLSRNRGGPQEPGLRYLLMEHEIIPAGRKVLPAVDPKLVSWLEEGVAAGRFQCRRIRELEMEVEFPWEGYVVRLNRVRLFTLRP